MKLKIKYGRFSFELTVSGKMLAGILTAFYS